MACHLDSASELIHSFSQLLKMLPVEDSRESLPRNCSQQSEAVCSVISLPRAAHVQWPVHTGIQRLAPASMGDSSEGRPQLQGSPCFDWNLYWNSITAQIFPLSNLASLISSQVFKKSTFQNSFSRVSDMRQSLMRKNLKYMSHHRKPTLSINNIYGEGEGEGEAT